MTLVVAPSGCGKTTLARQWGERFSARKICVAWYSVDSEDNNPLRFLRYLHHAVDSAGFGHSTLIESAQHDSDRTLSELSSALINRAAEVDEQLVVVIDNYSWITETQIHDQISYILNNAPTNLHLVILTSDQPPFPIGVLRARNQLLELNSKEICFTRHETLELLSGIEGAIIQPQQLREIHGYTQGWPAAVQIVAQTINKSEASSPSRRGILDRRVFDAIDEYIDDLFVKYPSDVMDMMVDTSIVDSVSPALWSALTGHSDIEAYFRQLRQQQVLVPADPDRDLFAYPVPVRRYLRNKLSAKGNQHVAALRRSAYEWYAQNGFWDLAIDHALACGDIETALGWMELHAMSLLKAGYVSSVIKWHRLAPTFSVTLPEKIRLAFAWAHAISRSLTPALELVAGVCKESAETLSVETEAECNAVRVVAYASADQLDQAQGALEKCSGYSFSDPWISNLISSINLYCHFRSGRWEPFFAEPTNLNAQGEGETNTHVLRLTILGFATLLRGQAEQAEKLANEALRLTPPIRKKDVLHFAAWPSSLLASTYYETGRFDDLGSLLEDRMEEVLSSGYLDCVMVTSLAAARNASRQSGLAAALDVLERAETTAIQHRWPRLEAAVVLERLRFYLSENRRAEAEGCLLRLTQLPQGNGAGDSYTVVTISQMIEIAKAHIDIFSGHMNEAINALEALLPQFMTSGNELFTTRIGTLLSIAYLNAGHGEIANDTFGETLERAEKAGFVSAIVDQGLEVGALLSHFVTTQENNKGMQRQRKFAERLLRDWKSMHAETADRSGSATSDENLPECSLSPKEREVLALMARGLSNKEIARNLGVTPETIKTHIKRMFAKLSVDRRAQAIDKAHALGLLSREGDASR